MLVRRALSGVVLAVAAAWAAAGVTELEVQQRLTEDCAALLEQLLGPGRARVVIRVEGEQSEVRTQTEMVTPTKQVEAPAVPGPARRQMPGFREFREVSPSLGKTYDLLQKDQEASTRTGSFVIKKIHAFVLIDERLPAARISAVQRVIGDLLRIDPSRGDSLTVAPFAIVPAWKSALLSPEGVRLGAVFAGSAALLGLAFLLVYAIIVRPGGRALEALARRRETTPGLQGQHLAGGSLEGAGAKALDGQELPAADGEPGFLLSQRFGFLEERKPEEVAELLRAEPPEDLALLFGSLSELDPSLASVLFSRLPTELQVQVTREMLDLRTADPERLSMLEQRLRTQIDFLVRGPDRIGSIVSRLPPEGRSRLMETLGRADTTAAERLSRNLLTFEDLLGLPPPPLSRLLAEVPYTEWAVALQGLPEALAKRVLDLIPETARDLVAQEVATPVPEPRVLAARSKILVQAIELSGRGQVDLSSVRRRDEAVS